MKNILKPYWLLLGVSMPQLIIFGIFGWIYYIINSELTEENIKLWLIFGCTLGILVVSFTAYGIIKMLSRKDLNAKTGIVLFLTYIPYLYLFAVSSSDIIPSSVPNWMLFGIDPFWSVVTLVMPSMVVAMLICLYWLTPLKINLIFNKENLPVLFIPAVWFILFTCLVPLIHVPFASVFDHLTAMMFVIGTVIFLFVIVKLIYHLLLKKPEIWKKAVIPLVTLGPLLGLSLNNQDNIFGNFSSPYYYILALFTGVLLVLPSFGSKHLRILLYFIKSITFTFSAYFFMIFLPYLPFSFILILLCGLGVLMLVPVAQAFIHVRSLWEDYKFLQQHFNKAVLMTIFVLGALVIPLLITLSFRSDKGQINKALNFVYQRDISSNNEINIDAKALSRTLDYLRVNKSSPDRSVSLLSDNTPLISAYYNWLVLDNLTLSQNKINTLEEIFNGIENKSMSNTPSLETVDSESSPVSVDRYTTETNFDAQNKCFRSWIHLELKNSDSSNTQFRTLFKLPEDSFLSNYYLYVKDKKKFGMIADKRAANWIFDQIVSVRRDPGILSYVNDNTIEFKVFPFNNNETRKTGFEIIHKGPININFEGLDIKLGNPEDTGKIIDTAISKPDDGVTFISPESKKALSKITRPLEYHFVIDRSVYSKEIDKELTDRVKNFIDKNKLDYKDISIYSLNYNLKKLSNKGDWQKEYLELPAKGGLYLDNAFDSIYFENYKSKSTKRPVVIIVTEDISKATLLKEYDNLKYLLPDVKEFYKLSSEAALYGYTLDTNKFSEGVNVSSISTEYVLAWPDTGNVKAYLSNDTSTSIVLAKSDYELNTDEMSSSSLETGLLLKAAEISMFLHPEKTGEKTLDIVKTSIKTGIMSPYTSYIVLETEAQEKVLLEKQKQILATKNPLDIGDRVQMSEPSILVIAFMVLLFAMFMRYKKRLKQLFIR